MKKEIKFRIFHTQWNRMFYSQPCESQPKREWCPFEFPIGFSYYDESHFSSLMQYTGLKDKNEKEIYEGDIVLIPNYEWFEKINESSGYIRKNDVTFQLVWDKYQYKCKPIDAPKNFDGLHSIDVLFYYKHLKWYQTMEIIGNVYENPELLK